MLNKKEFRNKYNNFSKNTTGKFLNSLFLENEYKTYMNLVDFIGLDGELLFLKDQEGNVSWEFSPKYQ